MIQEITNLYKSCSNHLIHISAFINFKSKVTIGVRAISCQRSTVFKGQYLPSSSLNYVAINKHLEKLPLQLY